MATMNIFQNLLSNMQKTTGRSTNYTFLWQLISICHTHATKICLIFLEKKKRTVWRSPCCFTPFVPSHSSLPMHEPDYPSCMGDSDTIMVNINVHLEIFGTGTSISEVNKSSSMYWHSLLRSHWACSERKYTMYMVAGRTTNFQGRSRLKFEVLSPIGE